jgi:hypothetical protein
MPEPIRRKPQTPNPLSLLLTGVVALALFVGVVIISRTLPVDPQPETTGAAPASDLPPPKAPENSAPARGH